MAAILSRWPDVELLLERGGKQDQLVTELQSYISDLRNDAATVGQMRIVMVSAAMIYVLFVNMLLVCMLFYHQMFFLFLGAVGEAALIIAAISSSVLLITKVLAGLFRTHGDRNKDEMLPPHLQYAMEALKLIQPQQ